MKRETGFTLIELLVVLSILSVLAIVTLVALKPAQRMAEARDVRRAQDINQILTGIHQCAIDKKDSAAMSTCLGTYTAGNIYEITYGAGISSGCQSKCTGATSDSSCLRLDATLADYFANIPKDPSNPTTGHTSYSITVSTNGLVVVEACEAELGTIKVSR